MKGVNTKVCQVGHSFLNFILHFFLLFLQMNYSILKSCVESRSFAPIQQQWLDAIVARVPPKLKESPEKNKLLQELCREVSNEFHNVIVKYTGISKYLHYDNI